MSIFKEEKNRKSDSKSNFWGSIEVKKINQRLDNLEKNIQFSGEKIDDLDGKLWQIQQSTRTLFGIFSNIHNGLRTKYQWYYNWHLKPYSNKIHWASLVLAVSLIVYMSGYELGLWGGQKNLTQAAAGIPKMVNYQGRLTNSDNIPVPDGSYNFTILIYDDQSAGSCLWAWKGSCGTPTQVPVTVTNGIFSLMVGDTSYQSTNALTLDFNTDSYWLQVAVEGENLLPRKRLGAVGYAYNSDSIDGIHAATTAEANKLLSLDASKNFNIGTGTLFSAGLSIKTATTDALIDVVNDTQDKVLLSLKRVASQTANIIEWKDENGAILGNVDSNGELIFSGTARHDRSILLSPEFPGAVITPFYGSGTDTLITGTMTSDADNSSNALRTYYSWSSSQSSLNYYTVALRLQVPNDFSEWDPTQGIAIRYSTHSTSSADNSVNVYVYNAVDTPGTAVYTSSTLVSSPADDWDLLSIPATDLINGSAPELQTPNDHFMIYMRLGSKSGNTVRIGDIRLNYYSKW